MKKNYLDTSRMTTKNFLLLSRNCMILLRKLYDGNCPGSMKFNKKNSARLVRRMNENLSLKKNILLDYIDRIHVGRTYNIPQQYVSVSTTASDLYLIDEIVAKQLVSLIKDDLLKNMSHVIELNPGLGFTTQQLLKIGIPFVHMYEKEIRFFDTLNKLCSKFPNQLNLQKADLYTISKSMHINNVNNNTQNAFDLLNNVQHKEWSQKSCMQIIGATNRVSFLRHLILSTVFQTCFMSYGRPIFYLTIPPSIWSKFTAPVMRPTSIMFQTIFNYHIFGKVDRKAFIPWNKGKIQKKLAKHVHKHSLTRVEQCTTDEDLSYLYVVRIEPKCETRVSSHGKEDLLHFWYFIRHNLYKPTARVIPSMEKLIPGCGVRLIAMNFNVFTQYRDLNIEQIYDLYLEFRSWPEFEESVFKSNAADVISAYNNYLYKGEGNYEIDNSSH